MLAIKFLLSSDGPVWRSGVLSQIAPFSRVLRVSYSMKVFSDKNKVIIKADSRDTRLGEDSLCYPVCSRLYLCLGAFVEARFSATQQQSFIDALP